MKYALAIFVCFTFVAASFGQDSSSAPVISQLSSFTCNANFTSCPNGFDPTLKPIQLSDGNFYGVTWWAGQNNANAGGTVWEVNASNATSVLHTFKPGLSGKFPGGENPVIAFVTGADGNFYGITESGGTANAGVFYKLTPDGSSFQVLHSFCTLQNCQDASGPIILGKDGNFYGTSFTTIFRLSAQGQFKLLHTLTSSEGTAGAALVQAADGSFYGAGRSAAALDAGEIFRVTPTGKFTIVYQFPDFLGVTSNLVLASDGNIYGATSGSGAGTGIFRLTPSGTVTFIHQMTAAEGFGPNQLLEASDGNLWGITTNGGTAPDRPGSIFAITLAGASVTHGEFNCATTGCEPMGIIQAADGTFYGNAIKAGNAPGQNALGTFFQVDAGLAPPR